MRQFLDRSAAQVEDAFVAQPALQAELDTVIGKAYLSLGRLEEAATALRRALVQRRALFGAKHARREAGRLAEAERLATEVLRYHRARPSTPHLKLADATVDLARSRRLQGRLDEADSLFIASLKI